MNILHRLLFIASVTIILNILCSTAFALEMKIYCFGDKKNISAPFPGQPKSLAGKYKQTFMFDDMTHHNSYQFYFDKYDYERKNIEYHLQRVAQERVKALNGNITSMKYTSNLSGGQIVYSYSYNSKGITVDSKVISVVSDKDYFSWGVQSYRGHSPYSSEQIINKYINIFGKNTVYCQ